MYYVADHEKLNTIAEMADEDYDNEGGDQLVAGEESHVDDSQLKLPDFDRAAFNQRVSSGEEDEDVTFKT